MADSNINSQEIGQTDHLRKGPNSETTRDITKEGIADEGDDTSRTLQYSMHSLSNLSPGDPKLAEYLRIIHGLFNSKYLTTGDIQDLGSTLTYGEAAVNALPMGHAKLPVGYQSLAAAYSKRYHRTGNVQDLEAAFCYHLSAVTATPADDPELPGRQRGLAVSYNDRYRRTRALPDLEAALKYNLAAVTATPEGHPDLPKQQQSLAVSYTDRYKRIQDLQDLEAAIRYNLTAVTATPEGHPELHSRQRSLGRSYSHRYRRTGDMRDLFAAFRYHRAAVAGTPEGHFELADQLQGLAIPYADRYKRTGEFPDLETALRYNISALDATPSGNYRIPWHYYTRSSLQKEMYKKTMDLQDLEAALNSGLMAVAAIPNEHPQLAVLQNNLAESYLKRYESNADVQDLNHALQLYQVAIQSLTAAPQDIWDIAVSFAQNTTAFEPQYRLQAYATGLKTLPSLLWMGYSIGSRHDALLRNDVPSFVSAAVITALQNSEIQLAVEFLEQGLSTTHRQILQLKLDHSNLKAELPMQYKKFQELSVSLQGSSFQTSDPTINYHLLAHERQEVMSDIRKHAGLEDFLLPFKYTKLSLAAQEGPVIMLNYTNRRTDAIIIISPSASPIHVHLSEAVAPAVAKNLENLKRALNSFSVHSREIRYGRPHTLDAKSSDDLLDSVISWLWDAVVKPVFDILENHGIHDGRIWWCPSGPFTYLPIHAAAPAESNFIQSYTPTLDTLILANLKKVTPDMNINNILTAVGVVKTSATLETISELPFVEEELNTVTDLFGNNAQRLGTAQATVENVMTDIQSSSWLHLACHGHQDPTDPFKSGLILYDGKLELGQILDINLPHAKFVYLSACETAMGDSRLTNEAMHLAGGFLAAGFQGAIGTLWSMSDSHGPKVAEVVYQTILGEGRVPDVRMAAQGLHLAIRKLRREGAPLHRWMPFIHLGI